MEGQWYRCETAAAMFGAVLTRHPSAFIADLSGNREVFRRNRLQTDVGTDYCLPPEWDVAPLFGF